MAVSNKQEIVGKLENALKGAKFRILNEILYRKADKNISPELFKKYHEGFKEQVRKWPFNPLSALIRHLSKMDANLVIADLGCGEAEIAKKFRTRKVHSFDLVAPKDNKYVVEADIRKLPLEKNSVDVVVICLALMDENAAPYIEEAFRILKPDGMLKIAEIRSRIGKIDHFIKPLEVHGFSILRKDLESNFFCFFDFKKTTRKSKTLPPVPLKSCVYKKR
ncbi:ribosomal RNA-processing protein 8 [Nematocida sp. AWRm77]|nr:ribosomal RNA-processing protein 8 [Nematocida sp. AWRm77]